MTSLSPFGLRCEHLECVQGLNTDIPRFSWALKGEGSGRRQTAYRIVLGTDRAGVQSSRELVWDSGRVQSDCTTLIPYGGPALTRDQVYFWSVSVWDEAGAQSPLAPPATIFSGLGEKEWQGQWIARYFVLPAGREVPQNNTYDNRFQARPADYMRRAFSAQSAPQRATLYITALGLYEAYINGKRVGDHVMAPGWTDYHTRVQYQCHDVTDIVGEGQNILGAILGEGWYSGRVGHNQRRAGNHYGGRPALMAQLHLHFADGSTQIVATDDQWRTTQGPICYSDFLAGEHYDARLEMPGWDRSGYDETHWQPVEIFTPDPRAPRLDGERSQPVRETRRLMARFSHYSSTGAAIFDLGQNIAGYVELTLQAERGSQFRIRHAERLDEQRELYVANLRYAVSEDIYVARGEGIERFKPRFTFHGFQYVEISAPPGIDPAKLELTGILIHTDAPETGQMSTGHPMVNQLISNIVWSQRDNFLSVPTDCPQRDERYGWTADAQVFWRTAGYNMDTAALLEKWMLDITDGQSPEGAFPDVAPTKPLNPYRLTPQPGAPGWGDAPIIMAWQNYLRYGDREMLARYWPHLQDWMGYIEEANSDGIRRNQVNNNYGDWLNVGPATDPILIATAYWAYIAKIMSDIGQVLGLQVEAQRYRQLRQHIRDAFARTFVTETGALTSDTQAAYLLALDFGLLSDDHAGLARQKLIERIDEAGGHLQTGFLAVRHLCPVLSEIGAPGRAFDLLLNEDYPSWGFSIRHGATTIWERWDGWTPERGFQSPNMNSFNHYAYGAVGEWLWARVAGLDWDESAPGFRSVRLRPLFDKRLGRMSARYTAPTGIYSSHWQFGPDEQAVTWTLTIPPNCTGTLVPDPSWETIHSDSQLINAPTRLESGTHHFEVRIRQTR